MAFLGIVNGEERLITHVFGDEQDPTYDQVMAKACGDDKPKKTRKSKRASAAPPKKKGRKIAGPISHDKGHTSYVTTSAERGDTRTSHASPLGTCYCKQPSALTCKRCGITKVKLEFEGVDFKGGRSYFYVLASKDAVKKPWSK